MGSTFEVAFRKKTILEKYDQEERRGNIKENFT